MRTRWLSASRRDLVRLHGFLKDVNPRAAASIVRRLNIQIKQLPEFPRRGSPLENYSPREVRSLIIGDYEVRYEIAGGEILILRIWHARENR